MNLGIERLGVGDQPVHIKNQASKTTCNLPRGCVRSSTGVSPVDTDELQGQDGPATHGQDAHATTRQPSNATCDRKKGIAVGEHRGSRRTRDSYTYA